MPKILQAPLRLAQLSLNGIGSYAESATLELKPLTVICGANGSGKSTWLKNLAALAYSRKVLPFELRRDLRGSTGDPDYAGDRWNSELLINAALRGQQDALTGQHTLLDPAVAPPPSYRLSIAGTGTAPENNPFSSSQLFSFAFSHPSLTKTKAYRFSFELADLPVAQLAYDPGLNSYVLVEFGNQPAKSVPVELDSVRRFLESATNSDAAMADSIAWVRDANALLNTALQAYYYIGAIRPLVQPAHDPNFFHDSFLLVGAEGLRAMFLADHLGRQKMASESAEYELVQFYSYWLNSLVGVRAVYADANNQPISYSQAPIKPAGFLVNGPGLEPTSHGDDDPCGHICHQTGLLDVIPDSADQLSAGFHQIAPIIMQAAVMERHGTLAIENPEVHLHPGLQLKLTEFFIEMAKSGRQILLETQSDLVIRRVLRAVLTEELPQSMVNIYFTSLDESAKTSKLEKLTLDAADRIQWPAGFLDDDMRESDRLLDAMYGRQKRAKETDEE